MLYIHQNHKRRASHCVAQFTTEDVNGNFFSFERKLNASQLKNPESHLGQLRRICRSAMRNALAHATVQLPGRDEIAL